MLVIDGDDDGCGLGQLVPFDQVDTVFVTGFGRVRHRVVHDNAGTVGFQFADHVDDAGITQVRTVLLEGQAEDDDRAILDRMTAADQHFDRLFGDELAHAVVDAAASEDDFRVVAQFLRLVGEIVGVYANAVATDQARTEGQEIPFRSGCLQHFQGVDADLVENDRQFVHQCDVQVALGIFDDLGGFSDLDARGGVNPGRDHAAVNFLNLGQGFRGIAGNDLDDLGHRTFLVARVDALGRIADEEILLPGLARFLFEDRDAHLFRGARIDRRFIDHDGARLEVAANRRRGAD